MFEALKKALAAMKPNLPLQLSDDFTRLETFVDVLENATPEQIATLWPWLMQQTAALFQAYIRLNFIENLFPMFANMMGNVFDPSASNPTEDDVAQGFAELEAFLKEHGGEATDSN